MSSWNEMPARCDIVPRTIYGLTASLSKMQCLSSYVRTFNASTTIYMPHTHLVP